MTYTNTKNATVMTTCWVHVLLKQAITIISIMR